MSPPFYLYEKRKGELRMLNLLKGSVCDLKREEKYVCVGVLGIVNRPSGNPLESL